MRALVQRVIKAQVTSDGEQAATIGRGLVVLLSISRTDNSSDADYLINKIVNLRIFQGDEGKFEHSAHEIGADVLVVSQFTLHASTRRGRRPSFTEAATPKDAEPLFQKALELFQASGLTVESGLFQKHMLVEIHNDGPVTIMLDSQDRHQPRR